MEVMVRFELSCDSARRAESIKRLFQGFADGESATELAAKLEQLVSDSVASGALEELIEHHAENLACLETAEADGKIFRAYFICGWDSKNFVAGLARVAAGLEISITRLTAQFDEGVIVCDLIDGKPHVEEFEDYETFEETGFVNLNETAFLSELLSNYRAAEGEEAQQKVVLQPAGNAKKYAEQERTILAIAKRYFEDTFSGVPLDFDEWYSDEYRATGALQWFGTPEDCAESNKAWAAEHGGVKNVDLRVKGQIDGLVSIDAQIALHDGKVKESNACWKFQDGRWKLHNSCAQILIETGDLGDEEAEMLKELDGLFSNFPSGNQ